MPYWLVTQCDIFALPLSLNFEDGFLRTNEKGKYEILDGKQSLVDTENMEKSEVLKKH